MAYGFQLDEKMRQKSLSLVMGITINVTDYYKEQICVSAHFV